MSISIITIEELEEIGRLLEEVPWWDSMQSPLADVFSHEIEEPKFEQRGQSVPDEIEKDFPGNIHFVIPSDVIEDVSWYPETLESGYEVERNSETEITRESRTDFDVASPIETRNVAVAGITDIIGKHDAPQEETETMGQAAVTSIEDPGVAPSSIRIITAPQDVPAGGPNIEATIEEEVLPVRPFIRVRQPDSDIIHRPVPNVTTLQDESKGENENTQVAGVEEVKPGSAKESMGEKSGEKGGRRRVKLVEAIRKLASKWSLRKQAKGIKPPTTEGTIEEDDSDTSSHTEIPMAKEGDSWNGKIIVQGRRHNDAEIHVVWKEGNFPFRDRECHDFLMDMADRMKKSCETVHEVFFAYGNGQAIISTPKTALRDLIKLQPKFILVKLKDESKGSGRRMRVGGINALKFSFTA